MRKCKQIDVTYSRTALIGSLTPDIGPFWRIRQARFGRSRRNSVVQKALQRGHVGAKFPWALGHRDVKARSLKDRSSLGARIRAQRSAKPFV